MSKHRNLHTGETWPNLRPQPALSPLCDCPPGTHALADLDPAQKHDAGKPRLDLLPFDALEQVGAVLDYGAKKYAARNWEKGLAWGRLLGAALRHLGAWARGANLDAESGLPHLAHAACCVLMLLASVTRGIGTDDRRAP